LQSFTPGLPSHGLLIPLSWLLSALFNQGFKVFDSLGNLVAVEENLSDALDFFDLFYGLFQLFTSDNVFECFEEILCLDFLLLSGTAWIDLTQSFPEIFAFISFEDLFLEVRPVKFGVRLSINSDNDPFEDIVGFGFSVVDFDFGKDIGVNFGGDLDSFFPFSEVLFLIGFD